MVSFVVMRHVWFVLEAISYNRRFSLSQTTTITLTFELSPTYRPHVLTQSRYCSELANQVEVASYSGVYGAAMGGRKLSVRITG